MKILIGKEWALATYGSVIQEETNDGISILSILVGLILTVRESYRNFKNSYINT